MKAAEVIIIGLALAGAVVLTRGCGRPAPEVRERVVTVVERDTVMVARPVAVSRRVVDTVRIVAVDTVGGVVEAPRREQVEYAGEDYRAWVSGVDPCLDSIAVYGRHETTVMERCEQIAAPERRRWQVTAGVVAGCGGVKPYVGVSFSF